MDLLVVAHTPYPIQKKIKIADAIVFATSNYKEYYDRCHQPLFMKVGTWAMFWLYKRYSISSALGVIKKLTQQYINLFPILEIIGCLAYKLDISANWKIHPVFLVAQLKLTFFQISDPFNQPRLTNRPMVFVNGDKGNFILFKIEQFLNKHTVR